MALLSLLVSSPVVAQNAMLVPTAPLTLDEAMRWAWQRGVAASVARLNTVVADARVGQRRADLLPQVSGEVDYSRQTLNLDEFGIPIATGVTPPFNLYHFRLAGAQTLVNFAAMSRVKSASDSSVAARFDAQSTGSNAAALAGVAYVRVLGIAETIRAREADSAIAADLLAQARQLADAGISAAIDVTQIADQVAPVLPDAPTPGQQPDQIVRGFISASARPDLDTASGSAAELQTQLELVFRLKLADKRHVDPIMGEAEEIGRMLHALAASVAASSAKKECASRP